MEVAQNKNPQKNRPESNPFLVANQEDFPTRLALEELNEATHKHYVTKHGAGTQTDSRLSAALGPMDHEA